MDWIVRDVKHTSAAEQRRFMDLSSPEQMLEIFLNGKETNGEVAEAKMAIEELKLWRLEIQSRFIAEDDEAAATEAVQAFARRWWTWGIGILGFVALMGQQIGVWDQLWSLVRG